MSDFFETAFQKQAPSERDISYLWESPKETPKETPKDTAKETAKAQSFSFFFDGTVCPITKSNLHSFLPPNKYTSKTILKAAVGKKGQVKNRKNNDAFALKTRLVFNDTISIDQDEAWF